MSKTFIDQAKMFLAKHTSSDGAEYLPQDLQFCEALHFIEELIESQRNAVIEELVKRQAEDEGLWFNAKYATEAYLQDALRQLHKAVEALKDDSAVPVERQCES